MRQESDRRNARAVTSRQTRPLGHPTQNLLKVILDRFEAAHGVLLAAEPIRSLTTPVVSVADTQRQIPVRYWKRGTRICLAQVAITTSSSSKKHTVSTS